VYQGEQVFASTATRAEREIDLTASIEQEINLTDAQQVTLNDAKARRMYPAA
jgi:hypothetical protein